MRTKSTLLGAVVIAAAIALTGCSTQTTTDSTTTPNVGQPTGVVAAPTASAALTGAFEGLNGKKVAGTVTITGGAIQLSGFSSDEGPDLHLYLTNGTDEAAVAAGVEISAVAFDKASQSFVVDSKLDVAGYTTLVVHCDKAKAVFGAAELSR